MSLKWLLRNLAYSWRNSTSLRDFVLIMLWFYSGSGKLIGVPRSRDWTIGFHYPPPVGKIRLVLRSNGGSDAFINGEIFYHQYYSLPLAAAPETVLDLGANSGLATVYFSRVYPAARLACVEPIPENLRVLTRNLELNSIEATVFPAAIDSRDGQVKMEIAKMDYGHKVAKPALGDERGLLTVEALSMATILERLGWDRVGLLKVDIEGHERSLLSEDCEWLRRVDAMCIECHESFGVEDLREVALRFGFTPPIQLAGTWLLVRPACPA